MSANLWWHMAAAGAVLLAGGCASFDGSTLVPGKSTAAEVEALMGKPAETLQEPNGDSVWFYPRGKARVTYAVRLGPDRVVRGVEQRLSQENLKRIALNSSTMKDVRALFGPPTRDARLARQQRTVWEYRTRDLERPRVMWVQFSDDGVVRELIESRDFEADAPGSPPSH